MVVVATSRDLTDLFDSLRILSSGGAALLSDHTRKRDNGTC